MNDQWTNRLSDYLDDEMGAKERVALEAHLATCADCRVTLDELRQVVARARTLEDREPAADLWPAVAQHIHGGRVIDRHVRRDRRRFSLTVPQLLAAGIALAIVSGGGVWMGMSARQVADQSTPSATSPLPYRVNAARWEIQTDLAIAELEETLARNEGQLDTATVRIVRQSLAVIDRAIFEAQRALKRDPNSAYLRLHLANTMRQKIELLRRANALLVSES